VTAKTLKIVPVRLAVTILSVALLALTGGWLYGTRLGVVPAYVMHDEAQGALQAQSIAATGRDLTGRLLPLYFTEPEFPPGRDPALIYFTALVLQVVPFNEAGVRTSVVLIAVLNVVLTFLLAQRLFQSTAMGLVAGGLLLLTPIHFIRGRMLLSPLFTIPFILIWLWMLWRFTVEPTVARLIACAVVLGLGMYSYLAAVVMMPIYLLITLVVGFRRLGTLPVMKAGVAFAVTLVPMLAWYVTHPERNAEIVSQYGLDAAASSPVGRWVGLYWSFFDPSFLFVSGDSSLINSTREAGFYPAAFAALIPIGVFGLIRSRKPVEVAIVIGFATAPLVSIISGAIEMNRVMFAIPFGVLAAAYGASVLLRARHPVNRAIGVVAIAAVLFQFAVFYQGYMGPYRLTSAPWFAGSAREAIRAAMSHAENTNGPVYVSREIDWVHRTWRFYAIADDRTAMIDRVIYAPAPPADAPDGSTFLCPAESVHCREQAGWLVANTAQSIDGSRSFRILGRLPSLGGRR
jgi:4-amino-4-deoxy-L-arabinose transferase-like glycosyltransferase